MPATYDGACAAIVARFVAGWVDGDGVPLTPVAYVNAAEPAHTVSENGVPAAWAAFEIVHAGATRMTNRMTAFDGLIKVHCWTPAGTGAAAGQALALAAAAIFRNAMFYADVTSGCFVRSGYTMTGPPRIAAGEADSLDGSWFATTATIPFTYHETL